MRSAASSGTDNTDSTDNTENGIESSNESPSNAQKVYLSEGYSSDNPSTSSSSSSLPPRRSSRLTHTHKRRRKVSTPSKPKTTTEKAQPGYVFVSDDPNDLLRPAPAVPTRPRFKGEIVGDVLYYGDSITWGMGHNFTGRYAVPWPRLLEERLRDFYGLRTVEAALCSRTTTHDDPWEGNAEWMCGSSPETFNGLHHFPPCFNSHMPKWLIVMLGTNDLKTRIRGEAGRRVTASVIAENCALIAEKAREMYDGHSHEGRLKILVVVPPQVRITPLSLEMGYDEVSVRISKGFPKAYREMCRKHDLLYALPEIDISQSVDGVHVTEEHNEAIADAVWSVLEMELPRRKELPSPRKKATARISSSSSTARKRKRTFQEGDDGMLYY